MELDDFKDPFTVISKESVLYPKNGVYVVNGKKVVIK